MIAVDCCDAGYNSTDVVDLYVWHEDDCPRLNELLGEFAGEWIPAVNDEP